MRSCVGAWRGTVGRRDPAALLTPHHRVHTVCRRRFILTGVDVSEGLDWPGEVTESQFHDIADAAFVHGTSVHSHKRVAVGGCTAATTLTGTAATPGASPDFDAYAQAPVERPVGERTSRPLSKADLATMERLRAGKLKPSGEGADGSMEERSNDEVCMP